jgi:hypothetical protein
MNGVTANEIGKKRIKFSYIQMTPYLMVNTEMIGKLARN